MECIERTQPELLNPQLEPDERFPSTAEFVASLSSGTASLVREAPSVAVLPFANMSADAENALGEFIAATPVVFPDWTVHVEQAVVEGTTVAVRWSGAVTHSGSFRSLAPTGRTIGVTGMNIYPIHEGRISKEWEQTDSPGMLQQLGVLPA